MSTQFNTIEEVIADVRSGRMVILTDDPGRENEGDLLLAADRVTPEAVNFMITHGRGLVCAPITRQRAEALELRRMVSVNRESQKTAFTVSVDAAQGVTTGISAADRAAAIRVLVDPAATAASLVQPGHVFPLQARDGGVLQRAGHTEAAIDLARLAGLSPAGVICEIMNADGSMARMPDLQAFREQHELKMATIEDLIAYRRRNERLIEREQTIHLPTDYGDFQLHMYRSLVDDARHLALVKGELRGDVPVLTRVHSECLTGDVFGSQRCDCGPQLHTALRQVEEAGAGVVLYMRQEGRGIGLPAKIHAYKLQEEGLDTVEANERLGFPAELREYGIGAQILADLGVKKMRFLTNNPKKVVGLEAYGLEIVELVPIRMSPTPHNAQYLETKRVKMGHWL